MNFDRAFSNVLSVEAFATRTVNSKRYPEPIYRKATNDDREALATFFKAIWTETQFLKSEDKEKFLRNLKKDITLPWTRSAQDFLEGHIALDGTKVIGSMVLQGIIEIKKYLYISSLGVLKSYNGRGIARHFIEIATEIATVRKMDALALGVNADNLRALKLYESEGFKSTHIVMERKVQS